MNWPMLAAVAAILAPGCGFVAWVVRVIVRDEMRPVREQMAKRDEDIAVLKVAVFNHLSHGTEPVEAHIREVLGYGQR